MVVFTSLWPSNGSVALSVFLHQTALISLRSFQMKSLNATQPIKQRLCGFDVKDGLELDWIGLRSIGKVIA